MKEEVFPDYVKENGFPRLKISTQLSALLCKEELNSTLSTAHTQAQTVLEGMSNEGVTIPPLLELELGWEDGDWKTLLEERGTEVESYIQHIDELFAPDELLKEAVTKLKPTGLDVSTLVAQLKELPKSKDGPGLVKEGGLQNWHTEYQQACEDELVPLFMEMDKCRRALEKATANLNSKLQEQEDLSPSFDALLEEGSGYLDKVDVIHNGISALDTESSQRNQENKQALCAWQERCRSMLSFVDAIKVSSDIRRKRKRERRDLENQEEDEGLYQDILTQKKFGILDKAIREEKEKILKLRTGLLEGYVEEFPESTKLAEEAETGRTTEKNPITQFLHTSKLLLHGRTKDDYEFEEDDIIEAFLEHSHSTRVLPCRLKNVQGEFEYKVLKAYDVKQAMEAQKAIVLARRDATSPYIVPMEGAFMSKERKLFLQFPLYHGLDLLHWLKQERRPRYLRAVCSKVAQAVQFVHSQDVVHRDIKVWFSLLCHPIT